MTPSLILPLCKGGVDSGETLPEDEEVIRTSNSQPGF